MKVLLTGITGNLGYGVYLDLISRGIEVIPCVRLGKTDFLSDHGIQSEQALVCDLAEDHEISLPYSIDYIVHCAGDVQFKSSTKSNERMMTNIVRLARKLSIPIYYASTAFLYKPADTSGLNNNYERDKYNAEQVLIASGVPHTIFRPSILVGSSKNGEIINFSGYYHVVQAFLISVKKAIERNRVFRFPRMTGKSNLIPVNQVAQSMGDIIASEQLGKTLYVTNPKPPQCDWVLDKTLDFFGIKQYVHELEISFDEYAKLELTDEELAFKKYAAHFLPYWSIEYTFPESICKSNLIDQDYINKILAYFASRTNPK